MAKETKYGVPSLKRDFPTDEACLNFIFDTLHSRKCSCGGSYSLLSGRRQFQCSNCRFQIAPCVGTIFEKSSTPLTLWFQAILIFSNAKSGISAREMERQLEVTYKCAYRILKFIRQALPKDEEKLRGDIESDLAVFGGVTKIKEPSDRARGYASKAVIIAAKERGGRIKAKVIENSGTGHTQKFIIENVEKGARIMTDGGRNYQHLVKDYKRDTVIHSKKEYVRKDVHINSIESFFGNLKRSLRGTFKTVSKEQLQTYLDLFVWHYNNRHNDRLRFGSLLGAVLHA